MFKAKHHHRRIKERHLREGYRNVFKPENHSAPHLAEHAVAFSKLRGSSMTRMQTRARTEEDKGGNTGDEGSTEMEH